MKLLKMLLSTLTLAWLGGCCSAQVNVMPKDNGQALAVSSSSSESCAYEKGMEKAKEYCATRRKLFVLVKENSEYRGINKNAKGVMRGVGMATGKYMSLDSEDDYRVRLEFRCR